MYYCNSSKTLENLIKAGMNVARLNFSHGTQSEHGKTIESIRNITDSLDKPIPILQDLAGPKIRIGAIKDGSITLKSGRFFTLTTRHVTGDENRVSVTYNALPKIVSPDDRLLLSDGTLELKVVDTTDKDIKSKVIIGGTLNSHKGINLPSGLINRTIFTKKDRADPPFGIGQGVDYVALSFVRTGNDINKVKRFMNLQGKTIPLIAKIEKPEALNNIDEIIDLADEMMKTAFDLALKSGTVKRGQAVVITAGSPVGIPGKTKLIRAEVVN